MEATATPASGWEILFFLVGVVLWPVVWRHIASRQREYGKTGFVAHLMGAAAGFCVFFSIVFILVAFSSDAGWGAAYGFAILTLWGLRVWTSPPKEKTPRTEPNKPASDSPPSRKEIYTGDPTDYEGEGSDLIRKFSGRNGAPSDQQIAEINSLRRLSIQASKKAGKTRKKDMETRGERPSDPLWMDGYRRNHPAEFGFQSRESHDPFTEIEFSYIDAKGDRSHRTVEVWAVDDEYFEGYCHKACDIRTFVIGRIRGKVLVRETGELLPAKRWAAEAISDPGNTGYVEGRPSDR